MTRFNDTQHTVIHTGGNIYNDYICDFDSTGRVIVVSEDGISLYANDRNYQLQVDPIVTASSPALDYDAKCPDCGAWSSHDDIGTVCDNCKRGVIQRGDLEPCEPDSQIADIESTTDYVFVRDLDGATLTIWRESH